MELNGRVQLVYSPGLSVYHHWPNTQTPDHVRWAQPAPAHMPRVWSLSSSIIRFISSVLFCWHIFVIFFFWAHSDCVLFSSRMAPPSRRDFNFVFTFVYFFFHVRALSVSQHTCARSEDKLWESLLFFHHVGSRDWTWLVRLEASVDTHWAILPALLQIRCVHWHVCMGGIWRHSLLSVCSHLFQQQLGVPGPLKHSFCSYEMRLDYRASINQWRLAGIVCMFVLNLCVYVCMYPLHCDVTHVSGLRTALTEKSLTAPQQHTFII